MCKVRAILLLGLISLAVFPSLGYTATIMVPADYTLIQDAVDNAVNGDSIVVDTGTYSENVYIFNKHIILVSQYEYSGDSNYDDIVNTIIDGGGTYTTVVLDMFSGKMQGFTVQNGDDDVGGGLRIVNTPPNPDTDSAIVCDNIVKDNIGTGMFVWSAKALIRDNVFYDNQNTYAGGGVYCYDFDSSTIIGNIFRDNVADLYGGAIGCQATCYNTIQNNTMIHNTSNQGGGIHLTTSSGAVVEKNIIVQNFGGGVYFDSDGTIDLFCNNVWDNQDGDDYWGCLPTSDSIFANPQFCDTAAGNYGLYDISPCAAANNGCGVLVGARDVACTLPLGPLMIVAYWNELPVNMMVIDPEGFYIGKDSLPALQQTLFPATYTENAAKDSVHIPDMKPGNYIIEVYGEQGKQELYLKGDLKAASYDLGIRIDGSFETIIANDAVVPPSGAPPADYSYDVEEGYHYLNGDADRSENINLLDVTFTINYLYKEGPEPYPVWAADANCDLSINILDATFIINYLYKEGPVPCVTAE